MTDSITKHNKLITDTKYFRMDDAINSPIYSRTAFIIANERITKSDSIGRYYTVFPTFKDFLKNRDDYKHCHEILVDHINNKSNIAGRLVFDFDIKTIPDTLESSNEKLVVPKNFKKQVEDTIFEVAERYYKNVDSNKFEFIWSTSQNPKKFSKHLTVKNLYFDNWIAMSKIFYQLFCVVWDESYSWIHSSKLIDFQIVRNRGSLRMVGSTKINGYPLTFDNEDHTLMDSLIRIYFKKHREVEQLVVRENINSGVFDNILCEPESESSEQFFKIDFNPKKIEKPEYDKKIYETVYEMYNIISPGVFKMGKINGKIMSLIRNKPNKCILSGKIHEQENAFCIITKGDDSYSVRFGCYRFCHKKKTVYIGSVSIDNLIITINPDFEPLKTSKKLRKKLPKVITL